MRLLHCADLHFGLRRYGLTQQDQDALAARLVEAAVGYRVDLVVLAGDSFHVKSPGPADLLSLIVLLRDLTAHGIEVILTPGNHDAALEVGNSRALTASWLSELQMPRVHAFPAREMKDVAGLTVVGLPYVHRRTMDSAGLSTLIESLTPIGPSVFVGHLSVAGSMLGSESMMRIGWDLTVPVEVFAGYTYAALGHIHHQQSLAPNVWYAGSPERHDFGEQDQTKGWLLVDIDTEVRVQPLESGARRMLTFEVEQLPEYDLTDAVVRLRVDRLLTARDRRIIEEVVTAGGARWCKIEVVRPPASTRARTKVDPATSVLDALRSWTMVTGEAYEPLVPAARELLDTEFT